MIFLSSPVTAESTVIVDMASEENKNTINEAIQEVSDGGEIIIKESERQDRLFYESYDGTEIGMNVEDENGDAIFTNGKSITIRGDGIVPIKAPEGQDSVFKIERNENRNILFENIMFVEAEHAIEANSGANVILEDVSIGSTITSTPFILNNNIRDLDNIEGASIQDNGVYYPSNMNSNIENVVDARNGELKEESITSEPSGLIYDKISSTLNYNPITTDSQDKEIQVGSTEQNLDPSDDYDLSTPYYSVQAAVQAASSDSVIRVYPRNEPYEMTQFTGEGVSGSNDIVIRGENVNGQYPSINGFEGSYQGNYVVRNMNILGEVVADSDTVTIDMSENYWGSSIGPQENEDYTITTGTSANILTEPFFISESQDNFDFTELDKCITINSETSNGIQENSYGCELYNDEINIDMGEFEESYKKALLGVDSVDFKQSSVDVSTSNIDENLDISINVLNSDNREDAEFTVSSETEYKSDLIEAQFSTIIDSLDNPLTMDSPIAYVTINDYPALPIEMDSLTLHPIDEDSDEYIRLPDNIGQDRGNIQSDEFIGLIPDQDTYVSRFNANVDGNVAFHDDLIPPTRQSGGEYINDARGTVESFEQLRTNPDRAAIIRPENPLNIGMSVEGIDSAQSHTVEITYALQGEDKLDNYVNVSFQNQDGNEIYSGRTRSEKQLSVTSEEDNEFSSDADTENLETRTKEIPLESSEVDFVNDNGELYIVFERDTLDENVVLLLYNVEVQTRDGLDRDDEDEDGEGESGEETGESEETVSSNPDERPGSFTVSFNVDGTLNTEYDSYDVEPGETLTSTVTFTNTGDTTVEGTFAVIDYYSTPEIRYPHDPEVNENMIIEESEEIDRDELSVAGGEQTSIPITLDWEEYEFGNHTIQFVEVDEDENGNEEYRFINEEEGMTPEFNAYVYQPATFEITELDMPEEHMTYDNFNSEIIVENIGDLAGERTVKAEFESWSSEKDIELSGADARGNISSQSTTVRFTREQHPASGDKYDFTFREYTTVEDVVSHIHEGYEGPFETESISFDNESHNHYRPNAPFGIEEGTHEYTAEIENNIGEDSLLDEVQELLKSEKTKDVSLNNVVINNLEVLTSDGTLSQRPTREQASIYGNAYPYTQPSLGIETDSVLGETYIDEYSVRGGYGTMYSYNPETELNSPENRGATPLNLERISSVSQPDDRYFSIYYSHQNRYCNTDLLGEEENVQLPESEYSESDTNVFLPFSADMSMGEDMCGDENRMTSLQLPRFVDSTGDAVHEPEVITHPHGEFTINRTNQETFDDLEEQESIMYAVATLSNPSDSQPATARFEIQSDREVNARGYSVGLGETGDHQNIELEDNSFDNNVVGVAAVELRPQETKEVYVPIVIRNDDGNAGEHVLSIHERSDDDYIRRISEPTPQNEMPTSPITGQRHSQFEVPIYVETYGDSILTEFEPVDNGRDASAGDPQLAHEADLRVNQVCRAIDPSGESREEMEGSDLTDGVTQPNIIFNVDMSGSVSDETSAIKDAISVFSNELGDNVNYALSSFANGSELRGKNLGEYEDSDEFISTVQNTDLQSAYNRQGHSFSVPEEQFANYGDQEGPNYLIMLGDGDHYDTSYTNDDFTVIGIYFSGSGGTIHDLESIADYDEDGTLLAFDTTESGGDYGPAFEAIQTTVSGGYNVDEGLNPYSGENENDRGVVQDIGQCVNGQEGVDELAEFEATYTNYGGEEVDIRPEAMAEFETRDRHTLLHRKNSQLTGDRFFANYFEDGITEMEGKTWSNITVDGVDFPQGEKFTMEPGETTTVKFERKFQEPGLYHVRVSPCRAIEGGPQHYNLQGFTGIPDTINYPTGADRLNDDAEMYHTEVHGVSRGSNGYNVLTTPEMANSTYNGGLGCTEKTSSVFVYDITNPVADFDIFHSDTTVMDDNPVYTDAKVEDSKPDEEIANTDFHVTEGGLVFLDGSSYDCPQCYQRPHFQTGDLETLTDSPSFPQSGDGDDFREALFRDNLFSNRMSTDNARIAGSGMHGSYPNGEDTHPQITEKGMQWTIDGDSPNYGQEGYCTEVDENQVDQHCYMERFTGINGDLPDYYEVVPHRFTSGGATETIQLQVWDDETLTEGEANTNITTADIKVVRDNENPDAEIGSETFNDLSYDKETGVDGTVWHRLENIFSHINYRNTPDNFDSQYDDTYEGTRTCLTTSGGDNQIGVSQSKLTQVGGNGDIDDGTRVIDDGNYVDKINNGVSTLNLHVLDVNMDTTRDGSLRCLVFEEDGPDGDRDRQQTFEYTTYDYANNPASDSVTVDVDTDTGSISIDSYGVNKESSIDSGSTANDFIWAYNNDVSSANNNQGYYRGGDVSFNIAASSSGVGIACVDIRLNRGSGLTSEGGEGDIHDNCALMGDSSSGDSVHEGLYDNEAGNGASYNGMGTDTSDGYHTSVGMFSAYELNTNAYEYQGTPQSGDGNAEDVSYSTTEEQEEIYVVDWHGNVKNRTYDIEIIHDETPPIIASADDITCSDDSCTNDEFRVSSNGYRGDAGGNGGTPIVDAEIISDSWTQITRDSDSNGCDVTLTDTSPDPEVISFPEGEHWGTVTVNNDASVSASASCSAPSGCGSSCNGGSDPEIEYRVTYELQITDAHGNTATREYTETIKDTDSESKSCQDPCDDDD